MAVVPSRNLTRYLIRVRGLEKLKKTSQDRPQLCLDFYESENTESAADANRPRPPSIAMTRLPLDGGMDG